MAKKLDYSSREYDDRLRQARRIGWNDDDMSSYERQRAIDDDQFAKCGGNKGAPVAI